MTQVTAILIGWTADKLLGDPERLPHPVVLFGKLIAAGERRLNHGKHRRMKGAALAVTLIATTFGATAGLIALAGMASPALRTAVEAVMIFYCLAGTTLIKEVKGVFAALDVSTEQGRKQVARIVGRDTSQLTDNEIRKAALETLAENLSDGVIAPTERYKRFGTAAARIDDAANYIPARLTALLMIAVAGKPELLKFVARNGKRHASPNSGYPEAALAGILNCRFGGGHYYFNEYFDKPFIGDNDRQLTKNDLRKAVMVNTLAEATMLVILTMCRALVA